MTDSTREFFAVIQQQLNAVDKPSNLALELRDIGMIKSIEIGLKQVDYAGIKSVVCNVVGSTGVVLDADYNSLMNLIVISGGHDSIGRLNPMTKAHIERWDTQERNEKVLYEKLHKKWGAKDDSQSNEVQKS